MGKQGYRFTRRESPRTSEKPPTVSRTPVPWLPTVRPRSEAMRFGGSPAHVRRWALGQSYANADVGAANGLHGPLASARRACACSGVVNPVPSKACPLLRASRTAAHQSPPRSREVMHLLVPGKGLATMHGFSLARIRLFGLRASACDCSGSDQSLAWKRWRSPACRVDPCRGNRNARRRAFPHKLHKLTKATRNQASSDPRAPLTSHSPLAS